MKFPFLRTAIRQPSLRSLARRFLITGKATPEATRAFMRRSGLPVFLQLERSKLSIGPVIHGSLRNWATRKSEENYEDYISYCAEKAATNRSNAIVVYEHGVDGGEYSLPRLNELFSDSDCNISRSEAITIANLGSPASAEELARRLERACQLTDLESIDMAYLEIDDNIVSNSRKSLNTALEALNNMCSAGKLLAFGFKSSLHPYTRHKPIVSAEETQGPNVMANVLLELNARSWQNFELALYPICLTSSIPSTYPMLDEAGQGGQDGSGESAEGDSAGVKLGLPDKEILSSLSVGSPSFSTPDQGGGASLSKDGEEEEDKKLDELIRILEESEDAILSLTDEQRKVLKEASSSQAQFTRVACDPLLCYINPEGISMDFESLVDMEEARSELEAAKERARDPWVMMDVSLPRHVREDLRKELDKHCPELADTPKVEDKALRAVLSLGCDLVMLDAECSAAMDRFSIRADQMLTHHQTADIFDNFTYYGI